MVLIYNTLSFWEKHLSLVILKSTCKWQSYSIDKNFINKTRFHNSISNGGRVIVHELDTQSHWDENMFCKQGQITL